MKKNKYMTGVLVVMAVVMLGSFSGCSKSRQNKKDEVPKEQVSESDQILENSDIDEPLHLVDEYLSEEDKTEINANSSTKKPQTSKQPSSDDEEENEDVTDSPDSEESEGNSGTSGEDNKEDVEEQPTTTLKPGDNTESGWGEVQF